MALHPSHDLVAQDQHLSLKSLILFDQLLDIIHDEAFTTLRAVVAELSQKANDAIAAHQAEGVFESLESFDHGEEGMGALAEPEFLPREDDFLGGEGGLGMVGAFEELDGFGGMVFGGEGGDVRGITQIADLEGFLT